MKEKFSVRVLAEIAIFAAIGFALDMLEGAMFRGIWVNGGSVGIAMVPVFIIAYRRGLLPGILCGLVLSVVQMLGGIYVISGASFDNDFLRVMAPFIQVALDYVLGYTVVGFAGAFSGLYKRSETTGKKILWVTVGVIFGGLLKYACHVAAGYFWLNPEADGIWGVANGTMVYSFVYNLCVVFSIIICLPIMILLARFYPRILNANYYEKEEVKQENKESEIEVQNDEK